MNDDATIMKVAKTLCALARSGGFCADVGGHFGCKNGRGEQRYADGCVADLGQLCLSGYWAAAVIVAEIFEERSASHE